MKRTVFGVILLAALLAACLLIENRMTAIHGPTALLVEKAGQLALSEDWADAEITFEKARNRWEKSRRLTASLADHTPMEDADALFAQLKIFAEQRETTHFAALCQELSGRVEAMADAHAAAWWNVL